MKTRKPPRRISKKKQAQLDADGVRVFSTIARTLSLRVEPAPKRSKMTTKRKPKAKRDEKFAHDFGSAERVEWISQRPCSGCGGGPCESHHITTGGTGRRAHHSLVIPLCMRCHRTWHAVGRHTFCERFRIVAAVEAETTAREWLIESGRRGLTTP